MKERTIDRQAGNAPPPRVSVLIAAHDRGDTLPAALASVARQSYGDWECVVVDDGSRVAVCVPEDPRFRLLRTDRSGVVGARNSGLVQCRGELVAVLDADDIMGRERLTLQVAALDAHLQWAAVGSHVRYFPRSAMGSGLLAYERWLNSQVTPADLRRDAWIEMPVAHPGLTIRTDVLRALGGWRDRGWPEDWDLFLRLVVEQDREVGLVPERLLAWRIRVDSLSRSAAEYSTEAFRRCRASFLSRHFLAERSDYVLWGFGATGRELRRELVSLGKQPTHIVEIHPRRVGKRIHGAPVIAPADLDDLRPARIVVSVKGAEARAVIRAQLCEMKFREGADFVCTA